MVKFTKRTKGEEKMIRKTINKEVVEKLLVVIFENLEEYSKENMFSCQGNAICIGKPMLKKLQRLKGEATQVVEDY